MVFMVVLSYVASAYHFSLVFYVTWHLQAIPIPKKRKLKDRGTHV